MIITIDPGVRGCGCAAWTTSGGELLRAQYVPCTRAKSDKIGHIVQAMAWSVEEWISSTKPWPLDHIVIERPQTYRGRSAKGDANDLLDVSLVVGALSLLSSEPVTLVRPSEWKGQVPKKNRHGENPIEERARRRLGDLAARVDTTCGKALAHNVWDAVGIGLWFFARQRGS